MAALAEVDGENEYVLYVGDAPETPPAPGPNFTLRPVPETLPLAGMVWREQVDLPRRVAQDRLDLFHALCLTAPLRLACPLVVTIHDMIWRRELPRGFSLSKHALLDRYYRAVPESAARRAAAVITVSECSRQSIAQSMALPPERIHVTYEAANARYRPIEDHDALAEVRAKLDLPPTFLLAMGSADPRKNVDGLLRAYAALPPPAAGAKPARHRVGEPASGVRPGRPRAVAGGGGAIALSARGQRPGFGFVVQFRHRVRVSVAL